MSALSGDDKSSELFLGHANSLPHVSCEDSINYCSSWKARFHSLRRVMIQSFQKIVIFGPYTGLVPKLVLLNGGS